MAAPPSIANVLSNESQDLDLEQKLAEPHPEKTSGVPNPLTRRFSEHGHASNVSAQGWMGGNDPDNPMNWPLGKRVYNAAVPGLLSFGITFGSSIYEPSYPNVMAEFNVSSTVALLGITVYVLGLAFGPAIAAPISETRGRRVVYLTTIPLAAIFILGAGWSQSITALVVLRFLAGTIGSPCLAVLAGSSADIWPPQTRATATSIVVLAPFFGPALGPAAGGYIAQTKGWRWSQWTILFALVPIYLFGLGIQETYKKIILTNRAKKLNIAPPQQNVKGAARLKILLTVTVVRPLKMVFTEPIVGFVSLYTGFNFSVLFGFFEAIPIVFHEVYHFDRGSSGLIFLAVSIGCVLATLTNLLLNSIYYQREYRKSLKEGRGGVVAPEHRLYAAMFGSLAVPIGLFWFAWSSRSSVHWISPALATIPFALGNLAIFV